MSFSWINVTDPTSTVALAVNTGYVINSNAGGMDIVYLTLPLSSSVGDVIKIVNSPDWQATVRIAQNSGQIVSYSDNSGNYNYTTAGSSGNAASSDIACSVSMVCVVADTAWVFESCTGSWQFV